MKKVFALLLTILSLVAVSYAQDTQDDSNQTDRVEIEFCVGDATLLINGQQITVEKPYVVGDGVTLVPIRVVTEAFGAEVGWVSETKTVTLEYPDVSIVLQIGNPVAEINGRAETLLAAPELSEGGFTMVPLRFISENFGAEVGYDNETKRITVVKEIMQEGTTVEGAIQNKNIGDSYYGWSMENPKDMYLDERSFDGMNTYFLDAGSNWIDICVYNKDDEYDFDEDYADWKEFFKGITLVRADKDDSDTSRMTMRFQAKSKDVFLDTYIIVTEEYVYVVDGGFDLSDTALKDEYTAIISTFDVSFEKEDVYDLSNVKDGMRVFEAENMKFSINIPQEFSMTSGKNSENEFSFSGQDENDLDSCVNIAIYSSDSVGSARQLAYYDYERNKKYVNEKIAVFEDVREGNYANFDAVEYTYEIDASNSYAVHRDVFFEIGEYVYNVHVGFRLPKDEANAKIDGVLNSIEAQELDFDETGTLLRNEDEREGTKLVDDLNRCTFEVPKSYREISASASGVSYLTESGIFVVIAVSDAEYTRSDFNSYVEYYEKTQRKNENVTIEKSARSEKIGSYNFTCITAVSENEESGVTYCEDYMILKDGVIYIFEALYYERGYSEYARQTTLDIIRSVEFD